LPSSINAITSHNHLSDFFATQMNEHEQLLDEWASRPDPDNVPHSDCAFIRDGILDLDRWEKAPTKVLFLLKEAYDLQNPPKGFDLRELFREKWEEKKWKGKRKQTWWRLGDWAYVIHNSTSEKVARLPKQKRSDDAANALLASAIVNVKKSGGKNVSDNREIASYTKCDQDLIRRQIALIQSDVIVCGGTWKAARSVLWKEDELEDAYDYVRRVGQACVINFVHPARANRISAHTLGSLLWHAGAFSRP
jgi:hypothetical protein